MNCAGYPQAGAVKTWCRYHEQWHWPRRVRGVIPDSIELFHDAMELHDGCYHERVTGTVEGTSGEIVRALLAAGWGYPRMADELEIIGGVVVVHSHLGNPCSRCGAMDIHSLDQCSADTLTRIYPDMRGSGG